MSDDERRRVAERLREHSDVRLFTGEDVERLIGIELSGFRPKDADNSYNRLADLIDPEPERTCRVEFSHEVEGDGCYAYFEYELTCGHEIAWGDQLPPSYCPECGRRVLYDSDKYL